MCSECPWQFHQYYSKNHNCKQSGKDYVWEGDSICISYRPMFQLITDFIIFTNRCQEKNMLWPIAWFNRKEVTLEPWLFSLHSARLAAANTHVYPVIREEYWHADTMRWDRARWDKKQNSPTNPLTVMGVHPWGDPNILPKTIPIHSSLRFASYSCFCCIVALGHLWNAIKDNHFLSYLEN